MLVKAALAQDRGLQRELRRQAHAHLLAGRRLPGLVVEDREAAVAAAARSGRRAPTSVKMRSLSSGILISPLISASMSLDVAAPRHFPIRKPCGDALEPRPPQRPRLGPLHQRREIFLADAAQRQRGIGAAAPSAIDLREFAERIVDRRAAVGGRQRHVDGIERSRAAECISRRSYRDRAASPRSP